MSQTGSLRYQLLYAAIYSAIFVAGKLLLDQFTGVSISDNGDVFVYVLIAHFAGGLRR
jgi:hypothetical protein